jgi:hypothetical protein
MDDRQKLREPGALRLLPPAMRLSAPDAVALSRVVHSESNREGRSDACSRAEAGVPAAVSFDVP